MSDNTPRCTICGGEAEPIDTSALYWCDTCQQLVSRRSMRREQPDPRRTGPAPNRHTRPPRGDAEPQ